ncbi:MAG: cytochrome c [Bacteroidia bacterium]|nr:cytochrome c [Bacteroidia bacterium]
MKPILVFLILCLSYLYYSWSIYLSSSHSETDPKIAQVISQGKLVWQKYNCQSCHQIYGLGGYLGPDLTNYAGQSGDRKLFLSSAIKSAAQQMPSFNLSETELESLYQFLVSLNKSGIAQPKEFEVYPWGMIKPLKHEQY